MGSYRMPVVFHHQTVPVSPCHPLQCSQWGVAGAGHAAVYAGRVGGQGGENGESSVETAVRTSSYHHAIYPVKGVQGAGWF